MSSWCTRSTPFGNPPPDGAGDTNELRCAHSGAAAPALSAVEAADVFCSCTTRHVLTPALGTLAAEDALLARLHDAAQALASAEVRFMDGVRDRMRRAAGVISRASGVVRGLEAGADGAGSLDAGSASADRRGGARAFAARSGDGDDAREAPGTAGGVAGGAEADAETEVEADEVAMVQAAEQVEREVMGGHVGKGNGGASGRS